MRDYPTNAQELLLHKRKNAYRFVLTAFVSEEENGFFISIDPKSPLAVSNPSFRNEVFENTGVMLPLRHEIYNRSYRLDQNHKLLGAGALLELKKDQESFIPLLKRGENAPSNAGMWTNPSGMCAAHPMITANAELQEELGILELSEDGTFLSVLVPIPIDVLNDDVLVQAALQSKQFQKENICKALAKKYTGLPLNYVSLPVMQLPLPPHIPPVYLKMPSDKDYQRIPFFAAIDEDAQTLTLSVRYEGILNDEREHIIIDAEVFQRYVTLAYAEDLKILGCTPALAAASNQGICFA